MTGVIRFADPERIGAAIYDLRGLFMLSQNALARAAGSPVKQTQVSSWERGRSNPSVGNLIRLANALGYDLALVPREDA